MGSELIKAVALILFARVPFEQLALVILIIFVVKFVREELLKR
jgi:hypothetical protein